MKNITKIILRTIIFLTIISSTVSGQTNVSGGIYTNTTWTLANSPYIVIDTIVVFPGVTLTIEPGVTVKFDDGLYIEIRQASIIAEGTATDSITFTSNSSSPTSGIWNSVFLNASTMAKFNYCNFLYANHGIYNNDQLGSINCSFFVKNSNFKHNNIGIYNWRINSTNEFDSCNFVNNTKGFFTEYVDAAIIVNSCNFSYNQDGFSCSGYAKGILNNCYASHNSNLGIIADTIINSTIVYNGTGVYGNLIKNCVIRYNSYGIGGTIIVDSSIVNNNHCGIKNTIEIKNSTIDSNTVVGIKYRGNITNCKIRYNETGIIATDSTYTITKNVIENNNIGIELGAKNDIYCNKICNNTSYGLKYTISRNIIVANNYWCTPDSASTSAVIYDGYDNINLGLVHFMPIDTLQCYLITAENPPNTFKSSSFNIFPNPTSDFLTVVLPTNISKAEIKIFNMLGKIVFSSTTIKNKTDIDVSTLTSGLHIIQITTGNIIIRHKFIKQ